ncbi:MAB_1171c family putative transporter [Nocardia sp. NPDC048505]|uniref:MAB_1171c family putative transporter n=1 Tax=unclassified Nocardia TaxID=2637762 RepID=UPI0033E957A6
MPTPMSIAITLFLGVVVAGRWWLVNELASDRLLNRSFSWNLGGMLLWGLVAGAGAPDLGEQLYLAVAVLGVSNIFGLATLLAGADPGGVWTRQRRYDAVALAVSAVTVLGLVAGSDDQSARIAGTLWAVTNLVLGVAGFLVAKVAFREVRSGARTPRQRLAYGLLCAVCTYTTVAAPIGALSVLGVLDFAGVVEDQHPGQISDAWVDSSFLTLAALTAVLAIPLVRALQIRTGWDRSGRDCRRLHPLWADLTAAVPEVVLTPGVARHPDPELRLYRMTIEIRDALVLLEPYAPADPETGVRAYADRIAGAVRARAGGASPAGTRVSHATTPADRASDLRDLVELARVWPEACRGGAPAQESRCG